MAPHRKRNSHQHGHCGHGDAEDADISSPTPRCFGSDNGADVDDKRTSHSCEAGNGHHHHHHHHHCEELSPAERIGNLKQLNEKLVKQVSSSRAAADDLTARIRTLESELQENASRAASLALDKNWLEDEKLKFELELASSRKEALGLALEKEALIAEKQELLSSKGKVEYALADSEKNLKLVTEKLVETQKKLEYVEGHSQTLILDVEGLRLGGEKMTKEISALRAHNGETEEDLNALVSKKQLLEDRIHSLEDACATAEREAVEGHRIIEALEAELAARSLEREGFQMQLKAAWQQIASLETKREARVAEERNLESQIKALEFELLYVQNEHDSVSKLVTEEKEAKCSLKTLLEDADSKSRDREIELDSMKSAMVKLQSGTDDDQQHILVLETQVSSLLCEKAILEETRSSLEDEVSVLRRESVKAATEAKGEVEKLKSSIRDLEQALAATIEMSSQQSHNVCRLEAELRETVSHSKSKKTLTRVALPLGVVVLGVAVLIRHTWKY